MPAKRVKNERHHQYKLLAKTDRVDFEGLTPYFPELRKKQHVTSQSLEKIEDGTALILSLNYPFDTLLSTQLRMRLLFAARSTICP